MLYASCGILGDSGGQSYIRLKSTGKYGSQIVYSFLIVIFDDIYINIASQYCRNSTRDFVYEKFQGQKQNVDMSIWVAIYTTNNEIFFTIGEF